MNFPPQSSHVGKGEAKATAAARGFRSVRAWLAANRAAAREHRQKAKTKDRQERRKYQALAACLDREFERFRPHQ